MAQLTAEIVRTIIKDEIKDEITRLDTRLDAKLDTKLSASTASLRAEMRTGFTRLSSDIAVTRHDTLDAIDHVLDSVQSLHDDHEQRLIKLERSANLR